MAGSVVIYPKEEARLRRSEVRALQEIAYGVCKIQGCTGYMNVVGSIDHADVTLCPLHKT